MYFEGTPRETKEIEVILNIDFPKEIDPNSIAGRAHLYQLLVDGHYIVVRSQVAPPRMGQEEP